MSPSSDIRFPKHSCPSCPGKPRSALWPRLVPGGRWFPAPSRAAVGHCLSSAEKLDRSSVRSLRLLVTERVTGVGDSAVSAAQGPRAPCRTVRRGAHPSPAPRAPCRAVHRGARPSPAPGPHAGPSTRELARVLPPGTPAIWGRLQRGAPGGWACL